MRASPIQQVQAVAKDTAHNFSKQLCSEVNLIRGLGVEGDAHFGEKVQHLSRVRQNPNQPNKRQVHLISLELLQDLAAHGHLLHPTQLGENILTSGIDLIQLPLNTQLHIGRHAIVQITGLRNPCAQIESYKSGLLKHMLDRDQQNNLIRKTGIMAIVHNSGYVRPGDNIKVQLPPTPHIKLERV